MPNFQGPWGQIIVNNVVTTDGGLIPSSHSGLLSVPAGAVGDIIVISPVAGKRARLDLLSSDQEDAGITITSGSDVVINSLKLGRNGGSLLSGDFAVGVLAVSGDGVISSIATTTIPYILTKNTGDSIVITKDVGATSSVIRYSYTYGD